MIERGRGARLSQQAPLRERIGLGLGRQELQRDAAAELGVIGQEHFRHAAGAELAADDVATKFQTRRNRAHVRSRTATSIACHSWWGVKTRGAFRPGPSLLPEDDDRVDLAGSPRGNHRREDRDDSQQHGHARNHEGAHRRDVVQLRLQQLASADREEHADSDTDTDNFAPSLRTMPKTPPVELPSAMRTPSSRWRCTTL